MKTTTLRRQFILRMLILLLIISIPSAIIQYYVLSNQVKENVEREASMIIQSIKHGITETDMASGAIEQQIDYKIESISKRISDQLPNQLSSVTTDRLKQLTEEMGIAGIDIFAKKDDIISVVKSTDQEEIGFTLNGISEEGNAALESLLKEEALNVEGFASYVNDNIVVLFTAQSGSREEPQFFKYAYYHQPGTDFIVSVFIEANEVYQFTQAVGPDSWIKSALKKNEYAKQIAVLDPRVFKDPSLAEVMYPPLSKVVYGEYNTDRNNEVLIKMVDNPTETTRIKDINGEKVYEKFIPYDDGRVIYVAMDYEKMSAPITKYSTILIVFGFIALILLFMITARFFNKIYMIIAEIISQIKAHEKGDFTVRSHVKDIGELGQLSKSTNNMADSLNKVLGQTREKAVQTQRHAYMLESEANNSVEKVYTMSMESTTDARESMNEIDYLIEQIEAVLEEENVKDREIKSSITEIHKLVQKSSNTTTDMTITLSDLLKSLHNQSASLSEISKQLLKNLEQFELSNDPDLTKE